MEERNDINDLEDREDHIESVVMGVRQLLEKHWKNDNELLKFEIRVSTICDQDYSGFLRFVKKKFNPDIHEFEDEVIVDGDDYFKE